MKVVRFSALLCACICVSRAHAQTTPTDIPGAGGGNFPNVMVVFDNSRSMLSPPNAPYDQVCAPRDDFWVNDAGVPISVPEYPLTSFAGTGAAGACENPAQPIDKTRCRNKLCIGKSVMYDALDSYADLVQIGLGSYYQYLRKLEFGIGPSQFSQCEYDVIAGPNEWARLTDHVTYGGTALALGPYSGPAAGGPSELFPLKDYTGSSSCFPTKWRHACIDRTAGVAALAETAKACAWTGTYATGQTYADRAFASSVVGPNVGATAAFNNTSTFPTGASSVTLTYVNDGTHPENAATETVPYYLFNRYDWPCSAGASSCIAGIQETGPFTASCSATYPTNAAYLTNTTANGPTGATGSNRWRITDGRTAGGWRNTNGVQVQCSVAEPCDMTRAWERKITDRYIQYNSAQVKDVESQCAGGASCVNSNQTRLYIARMPGLYKAGGNAACNAPGNYTGGPLNGGSLSECGAKTLAQSCGGSGGACQISAGTKKGPYPQTHWTYDNTASLSISYLDGTPDPMTKGTTIYAEGWFQGPMSGGACPGGDTAGTVTSQSFPTSPTWSSPPPAAFNSPDAGIFGCTAAGANNYDPIRFATDTLNNSLIPPVRRSTTCTVEFVKHDLQTDLGINRCYYRFRATPWTSGAYQCEYELRQWQYDCNARYYCGWVKTVYEYKPKYFTTRWQTAGGELVGRIRPNNPLTATATGNYCATSWSGGASGSLSSGRCPATIDDTIDTRCKAPRTCRLKWTGPQSANGSPSTESISGVNITRGRLHNFNGGNRNQWGGGTFNNSSTNKFCRVPDHLDAPTFMGPRDPGNDLLVPQTSATAGTSWCWGTSLPASNLPPQIDVLSDPYSPTLNSLNTTASMYPAVGTLDPFGVGDGRRVMDSDGDGKAVTFSLDGVTWRDLPPTKKKDIGWSYLNKKLGLGGGLNGGYASDSAALDFVNFGPGTTTVPQIKQMMSAYDPAGNPRGLKVPSRVSNQNTPLYGTLRDVRDYLKFVMDNDPAVSCREYAVLLITDGFEEQPLSTTGHWRNMAFDDFNNAASLTQAIADVRDVSGSGGAPPNKVRTYVVGFGDGLSAGPDTVLDLMARTAGTAIPDNVSGKAYTATSPAAFRTTIATIFANIVGGKYTKSKPVVAQTGTTTYYGFFEFLPGTPEWKGYLNKYNTADLSASGGAPPPVWAFDLAVNAQAPSTRRVYVPLSTGSVKDLATWSSWSAAEKAIFQLDTGQATPAATDTLVNFVLNPTKDAPYAVGTYKRASRVGDVYHSVPAVVGGQPPFPATWAGDDPAEQTAYDAFRNALVARPTRVVIGANDGQMHAICEADGTGVNACGNGTSTGGTESWSFMPPAVLANLYKMRTNHTFTVDGSFSVSDICLKPTCVDPSDWSTVLLGSLRQGGQKIFALDVTDMNTPQYLFEYGHARLGDTWSPPTVAKAKFGASETWVAVTGGGVSSTPEVGNSLLLVDMKTKNIVTDGSAAADWRIDQNTVGCITGCLPKNNVPARAALVRASPASPYIKQIFVGDTQGVLTRLNLTSTAVNSWAPMTYFDAAANACQNNLVTALPTPIFDADANPSTASPVGTLPLPVAQRHPIYQRPTTVKDSYQRNVTYVGTGDVTQPSAMTDSSGDPLYDYYYAVLDTNPLDTNGFCAGATIWVKRFKQGQKVLSEGVVAGNVVFVPTYVPNSDPCSPLGDTILYAFDRTTGNPVAAFDPPPGAPAGTAPTSKISLPGAGIPPDLTFVPSLTDPTGATGKLIVGTTAINATVGTYGALIRGFRRIK